MAIYMHVSRRNQIEEDTSCDIVLLFAAHMTSHILIDFHFYKFMNNFEVFEQLWCHNGAVWPVKNDEMLYQIYCHQAGWDVKLFIYLCNFFWWRCYCHSIAKMCFYIPGICNKDVFLNSIHSLQLGFIKSNRTLGKSHQTLFKSA